MKRAFAVILTLAALVALGTSIQGCINVINCNYNLSKVTPTFEYLELPPKLYLDADLEVENPNEVDVIINKIEMDFLANEDTVFNGTPTPGNTIPSLTTETITIPMEIKLADLTQAIIDLITEGGVTYKLVGRIFFDTEIGEFDFPITVSEGEI